MRKKIWVASPFLYVAIIAMLAISSLSYETNKTVFIIGMGITAVFALSLLFLRAQFWFHIKFALRSSKQILLAENKQALSEISLPVVITGDVGDILWVNSAFKTVVNVDDNVLGESILKYIYPKTLRQVLGEVGSSVQYKNKQFTVHAVETETSYVFYFVDDTYYKLIHKEYTEKKTVASVISFDNKDELIRGTAGGEESKITSEVENVLLAWSKEMGGILRKLSNGRYLMISDEIHMKKARAKRFNVLDQVRKIKGRNEMSATISIGIGTDAPSAVQSEQWAITALDMALGRGGDQVVILKKGDNYEFFGGLSKGVEKRDKVRTRVIAGTLADQIKKADKVYVMGHRNSDFDSMGSAIGIWSTVTKALKKNAFIVVNRNQSLALPLVNSMEKAYPDKRIFVTPADSQQEITEKSLLVIVDTHADNFVEVPELLKLTKNIVVIDHHRLMVNFIKNPLIFYHEPYASSASEMVAELIQYIDTYAITSVEAQALLAGITLDTKNFVLKTGIRTFEASAYLRRRGADTVEVKKYFASSMASNREKYSLIANAQIYKECAISTFEEMSQNTRVAAAQAADELLSVDGVKASFVLFGTDKEINVSARSLGEINVQLIMEAFGGGGHLTMAGAQIKGKNMQDAKIALVEILNEKLKYMK